MVIKVNVYKLKAFITCILSKLNFTCKIKAPPPIFIVLFLKKNQAQ